MSSSFRRPTRRAAIVAGAAGLAVLGAVGVGAAAFADGAPSPGTSQAAMPAPSGAPSGAAGHRPGGPAGPHTPHIGGTVLTVSGSTVTVKDRDGFTRTITLADDAKVTKGTASSSTSAIVKGVWVEASGTVDANGTTLDATTVGIGQPAPPAGGEGAPTPPSGSAPASSAAPSGS